MRISDWSQTCALPICCIQYGIQFCRNGFGKSGNVAADTEMLSMAGNDNGLHFWGAGQFFQGIGQLNAHRLIKRIVFFRSGQRDDRNAILYVDDDGWAAHGVTACRARPVDWLTASKAATAASMISSMISSTGLTSREKTPAGPV